MIDMTPMPPYFSDMYKQILQRKMAEDMVYWWFDQTILMYVRLYYWPAFIAGSADNVVDLFKPQTYNICKI